MNTENNYPKRNARPVARDISESLGKLPPMALDLEESVLGALLLEKNALIEIAGTLKPEHFYSEQHQVIYQAILELFSEGNPVDMRSCVSKLRSLGKIELIGGAYYIAELTSKVSSAANIDYHSRILIEFSIKRSLIQIASMVHHEAYEDSVDVFELYTRLNMDLQQVLDNAISNRAEKSLKDLEYQYIKDLEAKSTGKHGDIQTGFPQYDRLMGGLKKKNLIIIAARPAMGKSLYVIQMLKQIAEQGIPVGVFSLEMGALELVGRLNVADSQIHPDKLNKGKLEQHEFQVLMHSVGKLSSLPFFIDDTPALNIVELRARAIRLKTKYGVQAIAVDYLQLVRGQEHGKFGTNRDQEIGIITRTLKMIAKELDVVVIALSQLSREVEKRGGDKRPVLSDLRESGSIEQDSDIVLFLYRAEYYHITVDSNGMPTQGLAEVIVAKHRGGALDVMKQKFIGSQQRFDEWNMEPYRGPSNNEHFTHHYKNPLPSEKTPDQLATDETPF